MEIRHRISFTLEDADNDLIDGWRLKIQRAPLPGGGTLISVDLDEGNPAWPAVAEFAQAHSAVDVFDTFFSEEEVLSAEWCRLVPIFEHGYPQPESRHQWKKDTLDHLCTECGIGYVQKSSFRIKKETQLRQNHFMTLFWTYALFAQNEVMEALNGEAIRGFEEWDVIIHNTGQASKSVRQIFTTSIAKPGLAEEDHSIFGICARCQTTKYWPHVRGYMRFKRDSLDQNTDIQLTNEWFGGSEFTGHQEILVSRRMAKLALAKGWRGIRLKPLQLL